ncbi:hypothetical protein FIBSPDRAFT_854276, partial [Athelia psychrophila]
MRRACFEQFFCRAFLIFAPLPPLHPRFRLVVSRLLVAIPSQSAPALSPTTRCCGWQFCRNPYPKFQFTPLLPL